MSSGESGWRVNKYQTKFERKKNAGVNEVQGKSVGRISFQLGMISESFVKEAFSRGLEKLQGAQKVNMWGAGGNQRCKHPRMRNSGHEGMFGGWLGSNILDAVCYQDSSGSGMHVAVARQGGGMTYADKVPDRSWAVTRRGGHSGQVWVGHAGDDRTRVGRCLAQPLTVTTRTSPLAFSALVFLSVNWGLGLWPLIQSAEAAEDQMHSTT